MHIKIDGRPLPDCPPGHEILSTWHGDTLLVAYRPGTPAVELVARIAIALAEYERAVLTPRSDLSFG
jgi:hypothetical protein